MYDINRHTDVYEKIAPAIGIAQQQEIEIKRQ